ncbi:diguanylate cyclase [Paludibacterium yongneupense]|uniref:diguanylate cyclase n=1 Tax=Paludibacterium yongneupense TaxID=400061 RepID=UPI0004010B3C|nr:diguanylate cyclase [Paludibacterium yongneupense]
MPNFHSIKFKFMTLGAGLLLAALAGRLFIGIPFFRDQVVDLVTSQETTIANYVAQGIASGINERRNLLALWARDWPAGETDPTVLNAWLRERQQSSAAFAQLRLISPLNHRVLAAWPALTHPLRLGAGTDLRLAASDRDAVLGPATRGSDGVGVVPLTLALRDRMGTPVALLSGLIRLDTPGFVDTLQHTRLGASGGLLLISPRERRFVAAGDSTLNLAPTPKPGVNPFYDRAMNGFRGSGSTVNPEGVEEIVSLATVPGSDWFVAAHMPRAEALRPVAAFKLFSLKGGLFILIVIVISFAIFMSRLLSPLSAASRAISDMACGKRELEAIPVRGHDEVSELLRGFNHLVARLQEKEQALNRTLESLDQQASTDALTGAWNRRQFDELAESELSRSQRYGQPISILLLDLDLFKKINDDYGHGEGDRVLQQVADCIRWTLRKSDSLTRWGGEEFIVLMPQTSLSQAVVLAERVRASIASHRIMEQDPVTASIGVAEFAPPETRDQWVARADAAMYRAKRAGRNRIEIDHVPGGVPVLTAPRRADVGQLLWSEHFATGNPSLDAQHRALFDDSNILLDAIRNGDSAHDIAERAEHLLHHVLRHFQEEESLLLAVKHPLIETYVALHKALAHGATEQLQRFRGGTLGSHILSRFFAHDLVAKHVLNDDHDFFTYLTAPYPSVAADSNAAPH